MLHCVSESYQQLTAEELCLSEGYTYVVKWGYQKALEIKTSIIELNRPNEKVGLLDFWQGSVYEDAK